MNRIVKSTYKPRTAPKHKINLKNNSVKKIWVKKSDLNCCVTSTSLKTISTDSWNFDRGCSRHLIGEREFLKRVSKEDEITRRTEKTEPQEQSGSVTPKVGTQPVQDVVTIDESGIGATTETSTGRKTRDRSRLNYQDNGYTREEWIKLYSSKASNQVSLLFKFMLMIVF